MDPRFHTHSLFGVLTSSRTKTAVCAVKSKVPTIPTARMIRIFKSSSPERDNIRESCIYRFTS